MERLDADIRAGSRIDKDGDGGHLYVMTVTVRSPARPPMTLVAGFGAFVLALAFIVASSLLPRQAPEFPPSGPARVRAAGWERGGDTLTVDASEDTRWRYVSLTAGRTLAGGDTAEWEIAVRRFRVRVAGGAADRGLTSFLGVADVPEGAYVGAAPNEFANGALAHWYRYNFLTHLLAPNGHVYLLRTRGGKRWKLQIIGYYCPGLRAGCVTIRYAPLASLASR